MAYKYCQECDECLYFGEGDYACTLEEPKIVLTEHSVPTDDFGWCNTHDDTMEEANRILAKEITKKSERNRQRGKIKKRGSAKKATRSTKSN
jgi:hypothetical protein